MPNLFITEPMIAAGAAAVSQADKRPRAVALMTFMDMLLASGIQPQIDRDLLDSVMGEAQPNA